ncbi:hypothetical protein FRC07_012101 [Ceratobasidium sp. 392]|nr:hypothetical protein FRC07_012101 [Ceratobasidium sp. 392]
MSESPNQLAKRKRVLGVDAANIIEGSESRRAKRRKDGSPVKVSESASSAAGDASVDIEGDEGGGASAEGGQNMTGAEDSGQSVYELGMKLLETLKKATNSNGIPLSTEFLKLPTKRQYPDYYVQIKQPIAFDDIRTKLDEKRYASFEDVKGDFDLCFTNAKRYNLKGSDIWNAARDLQRLATSTYRTLRPAGPDTEAKSDDEDEDDREGSSRNHSKDGGKRKASRPTGLQAKYLSRLDKLINKIDSNGLRHSDVFMDMVPRKEYPEYYQVIKKPICFNQIRKRINQGTYTSPKAFMDEVELVFTNAITYNEDHSQIWEDAKILQATFHTLCSDWRAEYPDTNTSSNAVPKLKLKVPPAKADPVTVRLPHVAGASSAASATPQPQRSQSMIVDTPAQSRPPIQPAPAPSSSVLVQPAPGYARPTPPAIPAHVQASTPAHGSRSPSVQVPHPPTITSVELVALPSGRRTLLEQHGIPNLKNWSLRLFEHESSLALTVQLAFEPGFTPTLAQNGATTNGTGETPDALEIKCNTVILASKAVPTGDGTKKPRWDTPLAIGPNKLEVRVKGTGRPGKVWYISVNRPDDKVRHGSMA